MADAAKDSQRQSLLDTISKQQQDLQQQASDVHELHSQAQANDSKQQQRTEQLAAQQALIGQLQSEIVHHKGKFAAQQAASDAQLQEAVMKSAQLDANQQQLAELQHAMSEQQALHLNSQQAIAALQEHVSKDALTATASQSRLQMLTDQLEVQHEVLDQEKQKLQAALHNAAAAQEAALRLQNRLSEQQSQTADQQQEYSQAVHADSATMAQLQASVTVMQGKVHAADQAIAAHREQAHAQAKKTDTAQEQLQTMIQELALKTTAVDSLQIALQAANTNTDLHTTLVSSLQEAADEQEEMAAAMTRTWQRQLDKLTAQNTSLSTEVQSLHSKLAVANQTIALLEESSQAAATHDKFSSLPNTALCGPVLQDSTNRYSTAGLPTVTYKDI